MPPAVLPPAVAVVSARSALSITPPLPWPATDGDALDDIGLISVDSRCHTCYCDDMYQIMISDGQEPIGYWRNFHDGSIYQTDNSDLAHTLVRVWGIAGEVVPVDPDEEA